MIIIAIENGKVKERRSKGKVGGKGKTGESELEEEKIS